MNIPFKNRLFSLIYETLLLSAVTFFAMMIASVVIFFLRDFTMLNTVIVGIVMLLSWYAYAISAWKKGQTLAMKTWHIKLSTAYGKKPNLRQLQNRWIWAVILIVLIPGMAYTFARHQGISPMMALLLALVWWLLPFGFAWVHPSHQRLYDVMAGTALVKQD